MPIPSIAYAVKSPEAPLVPWKYEIRDLRAQDILIEVAFCGICHSDIHMARNHWAHPEYPVVPGHEFTGYVKAVGADVTKFRIGDRVGVSTRISKCGDCSACRQGCEQYCPTAARTYAGKDFDGKTTYGGYGVYVACDADFVCKMPENLPMDVSAPLLCAGLTMWSAMVNNGLKDSSKPKRVAVIGCGGLGHMAVQFGASFGHEVTVITRSVDKVDLARKLGAMNVLISTDPEAMKAAAESFDVILDSVSNQKSLDEMLNLLDFDGLYIIVSLPPSGGVNLAPNNLIRLRRHIVGSLVGNQQEIEEMLAYCAEKQILPMVEMATCDKVNECWDRIQRNDVKFRFVLDIANSHPPL